ncbi:MAG TPA: hypothetical protein ACFCUC_08650 [Desulfobacterales bacterium]
MKLLQRFTRYRGRKIGDPFDTDSPEAQGDAFPENFETVSDYAPIIAAARQAESLPVPVAFTETVMRRISARGTVSEPAAGRMRKWTRAASSRELGHCFLVTGFFYLVLSLTLFWGLQSLPAASWMRWQPAVGLVAALLYGALGLFLVTGGSAAVRFAEIGAAGIVAAMILPAATVVAAPVNAFASAATIFFVLAACGPSLFLLAAVHRYRTGASAQTPAGSTTSQIGRSIA